MAFYLTLSLYISRSGRTQSDDPAFDGYPGDIRPSGYLPTGYWESGAILSFVLVRILIGGPSVPILRLYHFRCPVVGARLARQRPSGKIYFGLFCTHLFHSSYFPFPPCQFSVDAFVTPTHWAKRSGLETGISSRNSRRSCVPNQRYDTTHYRKTRIYHSTIAAGHRLCRTGRFIRVPGTIRSNSHRIRPIVFLRRLCEYGDRWYGPHHRASACENVAGNL